MAMQEVNMFACKTTSGKLPILVISYANVAVGGAIYIAYRVAEIVVRNGNKITRDT